MKKDILLSQRIHNAVASQECEKLKALHTYVHARAMNIIEMDSIWTHRDDATWGHSTGRMISYDDIYLGTVTTYDAKVYARYIKLWPHYPKIVAGKDPRPLYEVSMHCLCSDIIEVADDGKTATSLYYTPGFIYSYLSPEKQRRLNSIWERYGTDYICEDGKWLLFHEQVCPDLFSSTGSMNTTVGQYAMLADKEHEIYSMNDPTPFTLRKPMHADFTPVQPPLDTCPAPQPHKTLPEQNIGNIIPYLERPKRDVPMGY